MATESRHAILIGVNQYASGTHAGLLAPRNDVAAWFRLLRRLGVPAANIRILTTPVLTPDELRSDEAVCEEATTENVRAAVADTAARLTAGGAAAVGFLFYSGHGELAGATPRVFLSDYTADGTPLPESGVAERGVLLQSGVEFALAAARQASITCVWDTCRQAPPSQGMPSVPLRPANVLSIPTAHGGQDAFERCFDGTWRGQFSWAALTVLEQWPHRTFAGTPYVAISYRTLLARIANLIHALAGGSRPVSREAFQAAVDRQLQGNFGASDGTAAPVPSDTLLAGLAYDLHLAQGSTDQAPDPFSMQVDPAWGFLLPSAERPPLAESPKAAPSREFPAGTTELKALPSGPVFTWILITASSTTYKTLPGYLDSNQQTLLPPSGFTATFQGPGPSTPVPSNVVIWNCQTPPPFTPASGTAWGWYSTNGEARLAIASGSATWAVYPVTSGTPTTVFWDQRNLSTGLVPPGTSLTFGTTPVPAPSGSQVGKAFWDHK